MSRSGTAGGERPDQIGSGQEDRATLAVLDEYYASFNERRFVDAAALFGDNAVLQQLPQQKQERGSIGYLQFVSAWLKAFPDAAFIVRRIASEDGRNFEVNLEATGSHCGPLDFGGWVFRPTGMRATFGIRELLEVREGKIVFSSLTLNLHELVDKLAKVDGVKLIEHIERLRQLAASLREAPPESMRARELTAAIGMELDAARHVVRPYYRPR
jgi:predicted ester cyclase